MASNLLLKLRGGASVWRTVLGGMRSTLDVQRVDSARLTLNSSVFPK